MNQAKLLKLDEFIEEEVMIEINGVQFMGFSAICPYKIFINKIYPVCVSITILDDPEITELTELKYGLEEIGDAYGYFLYGQVCEDSVDIGNNLKIESDFFKEIPYLLGCFVRIKADRLSVEFL